MLYSKRRKNLRGRKKRSNRRFYETRMRGGSIPVTSKSTKSDILTLRPEFKKLKNQLEALERDTKEDALRSDSNDMDQLAAKILELKNELTAVEAEFAKHQLDMNSNKQQLEEKITLTETRIENLELDDKRRAGAAHTALLAELEEYRLALRNNKGFKLTRMKNLQTAKEIIETQIKIIKQQADVKKTYKKCQDACKEVAERSLSHSNRNFDELHQKKIEALKADDDDPDI